MLNRLLMLAALVAPASARAASCVELDPGRDNLSTDDQRAATVLFEDALRDAGRQIGPAPCEEPWQLGHTRLGDAITVRVTALGRSDKLAVGGLEELPVAYERLVRALIEAKPVGSTADRSSVTEADSDKKRVQADSLAYVQLGFGILPTTVEAGPNLGGGYRFELDRLGIDVGLSVTIPTGGQEFVAGSGKLAVYCFVDPEASATPYFGGGLGLGGSTSAQGDFFGLVGVASVGYSFLRETQVRLFPQVDLDAPIGTTDSGAWVPALRATAGVAFIPPSRSRRRSRASGPRSAWGPKRW